MSHADTTVPSSSSPSRRHFLKTSATGAAGLVLGFYIPGNGALAQTATPEMNAWVVVNPDNTVVVRIARTEMGQGTLTGLAQLVAEELEADWKLVRTEQPTPGQNLARKEVWGNMSTDTSKGIRDSQEYVRKGGASARMMLVQAAANEWKVPVAECRAAKSMITHTPSGKKITYGKVAAAAAKLTPPTDVPLKDPKNWTIAGKRLARLDTAEKTTGALVYGMDLKLPGMLHASIKACPVIGGTVKSFDAAATLKRPGIKKVMQVGTNAVAVVADNWWRANTALEALPINWDFGVNANLSSAVIDASLKGGLTEGKANIGQQKGDVVAAIAGSARKIEAVYDYPYETHATMETKNATVKWTPGGCIVYAGTQDPMDALRVTAATAGLPIEKCEVIKMPTGCGLGVKGVHNWVAQAVEIAKAMPDVPVKLTWSREEDISNGHYHPITKCKMTAGLDDKGEITGFQMRISGPSILAPLVPEIAKGAKDPVLFQGLDADGMWGMGYDFNTLLIDHVALQQPPQTWFFRAVCMNENAMYLECFIDEIAHATQQDPLALRRKLMANHSKHLAVLNAVADKLSWGKPPPKGVFRGLCQAKGFGSYAASGAEVSVSKDGKLKIHRIVIAIDPGHVVNPQQIEAQAASGFAVGLSAALYGQCTLKDGKMEQNNFNTYPMLKMADMPKVEAILMPSGGFFGGVGESIGCVAAPAVLNAIFAATGKRIRSLPVSNHDLKKA